MTTLRATLTILFATLAAACVTVDAETNEVLPRGDQRYHFDEVERRAENLRVGMTKMQAMIALGSPAEKADAGHVWVYLPERPAVLVPSRALQLRFEGDELAEFGYHAIVLGQKL
ncbi:MAG: hypothetical protein AAF726_14580 [Planctomycetota bacterium]